MEKSPIKERRVALFMRPHMPSPVTFDNDSALCWRSGQAGGAQWRPRLTCHLNGPFLPTLPTLGGARRGVASRLLFESLLVTGFDGFFWYLESERNGRVTLRHLG